MQGILETNSAKEGIIKERQIISEIQFKKERGMEFDTYTSLMNNNNF